MITASHPLPRSRLDADDPHSAERFRALEEPRRRRLACALVREALAELTVTLPPVVLGLLGTAGIATPAQLADLDRRAASTGGPPLRAAEEAVHDAFRFNDSSTTEIYDLRLHVDFPISPSLSWARSSAVRGA